MSTRRPADTTPDLFSAHAPAKAAEPPTAPQERAAAQPRHFLPKDLAGALKQLDDREIDALLSAVTTEAERAGQTWNATVEAAPSGGLCQLRTSLYSIDEGRLSQRTNPGGYSGRSASPSGAVIVGWSTRNRPLLPRPINP